MSQSKSIFGKPLEPSGEPLPELTPRTIAFAQISKLRSQIRDGDKEAARDLLDIASIATREFQMLRYEFCQLQAEIAKRKSELPAMVSHIRPPYDNRPKEEKELPFEVWETLKLPIGEDLPYKTKHSSKKRGPGFDYLYYLVTEVILPHFEWIRSCPADSDPMNAEIRILPELKIANASNWAITARNWIVGQNWPIEDSETWIHGICKDRARISSDTNKRKAKVRINRRPINGVEDEKKKEADMKEIKARSVTLENLQSALRDKIQSKLEFILKS